MRPFVAVILASLWIGAALLLAASVAPAAFATIPSHAVAGAVVGRVLSPLFLSGFIAAVILTAAGARDSVSGRRTAVAAPVVWGLACAVSQFILAPRIHALQVAIGGPVDALAADDGRRLAFGRLHATILGVYMLAIIAAAAIVVSSVSAARSRLSHT
jgi:Domain of unknown function (DUF4149)